MKNFKIQIILLVIQTVCLIGFLFTEEFKPGWIKNIFNFLTVLFVICNIFDTIILLRYKK